MILRVFLVIGCILLALAAKGQDPRIDAPPLLDSLEEATTERQRVDLMNKLAFLYYDYNDSIAFQYNTGSLRLARRIGYPQGEKEALTYLAIYYLNSSDFRKSISYLRRSTELEVEGTLESDAYSYDRLTYIYLELGKFDSARLFLNRGLALPGIRNDLTAYYRLLRMEATLDLQLWKLDAAAKVLYPLRNYYHRTNQQDQYIEVLHLLTLLKEQTFEYDSMRWYADHMARSIGVLEHPHYRVLNNLSYIRLELQQANYLKALNHCIDGINELENYRYEPHIANLYFHTGNVYNELLQYNVATEYFFKALNITERLGMSELTGMIYCDLAWASKSSGSYDIALNYLNRAEAIFSENGDKFGLSYAHNLRGLTLVDLAKPIMARDEFLQSEQLRQEIGNRKGIAAVISNIGLTYKMEGNYQKALEYQIRASELEVNIEDPVAKAMTISQITSLYILLNNPSKAAEYLEIVRKTASKYKSATLWRDYHEYSYQLAKSQKDFPKAIFHLEQKQRYRDSIELNENSTKLAELQALYKIENKDREMEAQRKEISIKEATLAQRNRIIWFGTLALVLLLASLTILFFYYRDKKRSNRELVGLNREIQEQNEEIKAQAEELTEANETIHQINQSLEKTVEQRTTELSQAYHELDTFFYRSSHDFRRPLTTFMGLAEVAKVTVQDEKALQLFGMVDSTARSLDKMLTKFQSISAVSAKEVPLDMVHFPALIQEVVNRHESAIQSLGARITYDLRVQSAMTNSQLWVMVLDNLLENALHFHVIGRPLLIKIACSREDNVLNLMIDDNGMGMDPIYQEQAFQLYFRGSERSTGTGLGLFIVRKAIHRMGGSVQLKSTLDKGTTIMIAVPCPVIQ